MAGDRTSQWPRSCAYPASGSDGTTHQRLRDTSNLWLDGRRVRMRACVCVWEALSCSFGRPQHHRLHADGRTQGHGRDETRRDIEHRKTHIEHTTHYKTDSRAPILTPSDADEKCQSNAHSQTIRWRMSERGRGRNRRDS